MPSQLRISVGQYSDKGRKPVNQDFHAVYIPKEPQLTTKGVALALADGISSSEVSQEASQAAVAGFMEDYFCTSDAWSVKKSAQRVLMATNSWLYAQTRQSQFRYDRDRGYVCTLSAMIVKSTTAHLFHVGDARIYRVRANTLECLTSDHRLRVSQDKSYLSRALGMNAQLEIDYQALPVETGDLFMLMTDGVYEHASRASILDAIQSHGADLPAAARAIVEEAYRNGSEDNLTAQIVRIAELPTQGADELYRQMTELPFPPMLEARAQFDGYRIERELHASSRSHVYLATDLETRSPVVVKTPSIDLRTDAAYLERFLMEEWIARRINSAHVVKAWHQPRKRNYLYTVTEYIDGQTLTQWMIDNPKPDLAMVRDIVEQIAKGLRAFHRLEMLHQDLRPENIMVDRTGTVKLIDFGSTRVAGVMDLRGPEGQNELLGTAQYTAPEYFLGEPGTARSDLFSLGVISYQMLTGRLPYGAEVAKARTRAAQNKLRYAPLPLDSRDIPAWVDQVIRKAVHPVPWRRYEALSEFVFDLRHPSRALLNRARPPLMERNPVLFWKGLSLALTLIITVLLVR